MDIFVARQPIFDVEERVVGYELLHRGGADEGTDEGTDDAVTATTQLLSEHLLADAWDQLTGGRLAWVRFPPALLVDETVLLTPRDRTVVQVGRADADLPGVVEMCGRLVGGGFVLAVDGVDDGDDDNDVLGIANIIKVDFTRAGAVARKRLAARFAGRSRVLANRVETRSDQAAAVELGYTLLQGRFLSEPATVTRKTIDRTRAGVMAAMAAATKDPMDYDEVERAIKRDVALTDRLLRYLNSAALGLRQRVTTISYALVALGERQVRRWVTINALAALDTGNSRELLVSTLFRARMCERLAALVGFGASPFELFLTGMYSQVHLLLGTDLDSTLDQMPIPDIVRSALVEREGPLWDVLQLVVAWERGDWDGVSEGRQALGIEPTALSECYIQAVNFADAVRPFPRAEPRSSV